MGNLIYIANTSLDGYTEDKEGKYDWTEPSDEIFSFITDLLRLTHTHLYGRRMYEAMSLWETDPSLAGQSPLMRDFAETWGAADKIVYSSTLETVPTRRTQLERTFDPEAVRKLKASGEQDILIGGPGLTAHALRAGLVDEIHLFVAPIVLGGGKPALPADLRLELKLLAERRYDTGTVYLRYRTGQGRAV